MSLPTNGEAQGIRTGDVIVFWSALPLWIMIFLVGTLVNSQPYRQAFTKLDGMADTLVAGAKVAVTYTLTNVCILCLLASLLGMVAAKVQLGSDADKSAAGDRTSPGISALLRGFFVYLALIAGVMVL